MWTTLCALSNGRGTFAEVAPLILEVLKERGVQNGRK